MHLYMLLPIHKSARLHKHRPAAIVSGERQLCNGAMASGGLPRDLETG